MVHFINSKSSSNQDVLVIRDNANDLMKTTTILTVYKSVYDRCIGPSNKITTTHPMKNWSTLIDFKSLGSLKALTLIDSTQRSLNCLDQIPLLGRKMADGEVQCCSTLEFPSECFYREKYWEWTEDVLSRYDWMKAAGIYDAV